MDGYKENTKQRRENERMMSAQTILITFISKSTKSTRWVNCFDIVIGVAPTDQLVQDMIYTV
jgi:hypothetical protein